MHFRAAALLPLALAAFASAAPLNSERSIVDFVQDHANGIQDAAAGAAGTLAGGPIGGIVGVKLSDAVQSLKRRTDLTPEERGFISWVDDHSNGLQDIAAGAGGAIVGGATGGPIGAIGGATAGVELSDTIQSHTRRGLESLSRRADLTPEERGFISWVDDHSNGLQDIAAGAGGAIVGGATGGPIGAIGGATAGVELSDTIQSHTRRGIESLKRRTDLTPEERGIIDFVEDHTNGLQDIALGTAGGLAGAAGGPAGIVGGVAAGVGLSNTVQSHTRREAAQPAKDIKVTRPVAVKPIRGPIRYIPERPLSTFKVPVKAQA